MAFNASTWANPGQFSNISTYSGLDEKEGLHSVRDVMKEAVTGAAPPPSGGTEQSLGQKLMGAVAPNLQRYSTAAGQIGQGDFSGAGKTMISPNQKSATPAPTPAAPAPINNDYDYEHGLDPEKTSLAPNAMPQFGTNNMATFGMNNMPTFG
jgi:hypothetical protein